MPKIIKDDKNFPPWHFVQRVMVPNDFCWSPDFTPRHHWEVNIITYPMKYHQMYRMDELEFPKFPDDFGSHLTFPQAEVDLCSFTWTISTTIGWIAWLPQCSIKELLPWLQTRATTLVFFDSLYRCMVSMDLYQKCLYILITTKDWISTCCFFTRIKKSKSFLLNRQLLRPLPEEKFIFLCA